MITVGSSNFLQLAAASSCNTSPLSISAGSSIYLGISTALYNRVLSVTDNQGHSYVYSTWTENFDTYLAVTEIWYTDGIPGVGTLATNNLIITVTMSHVRNLCVSVTEIIGAANPSPSPPNGFGAYGTGDMSVSIPMHAGEGFLLAIVTSTSPQYGTNVLTSTTPPLYKISGSGDVLPSGVTIATGTFGYNGPFTNENITLDVTDGGPCLNPNSCATWSIATVSILLCPSRDCAGICGGSSLLDCAGNCYLPPALPPKVYDCAHVCGGTSYIDSLGQCAQPGSQSKKDSMPNPTNSKVKNYAGVIILIILLTSVIILLITHRCDKK
jgi:hypothetical protein